MAQTLTSSSAPPLSPADAARYSRNMMLAEVGEAGQRRLAEARVLLIGAGGLGSPTALYLAAAGVGTLGIVDGDRVDVTNLQRQIAHRTADVGTLKTESAARSIGALNPAVHVERFDTRIDPSNALEIMRGFDVVVDGSDNFATRYLVNDAAVLAGIPNVYGAVLRFEGQASLFPADGPCYRCIFREPPPAGAVPTCSEAGVLGVLPGLVGTIQATETLKHIIGIGHSLAGRLLLIDGLSMEFREIELRRDPTCPSCGDRAAGGRTIRSLDERAADYVDVGCEVKTSLPGEITALELAAMIERGDDIDLVDVREPYEWNIARIPGARLLPLGDVPEAAGTWSSPRPVVVYCKVGARSARAAELLRARGVANVANLSGGILAWRDEVDPSLPAY